MRNRSFVVQWVSVLFLGVCLSTGTGHAWEFSMKGTITLEHELYSQLGSKGFFGRYDQDNSSGASGANLAARNGWLGNEITGNNLASGSDVAGATMYMTIYPKIEINKALSIQGSYRIGSWENPYVEVSRGRLDESKYFNSEGYGLTRSFSPGYWNTLWITASLPWGIVTYGKQPVIFGTGLMADGEDEATFEALQLAVPYGPLTFAFYYYPWRRGLFVRYPVLTDRNAQFEPEIGGVVLYNAGNFSMGMFSEYWKMHRGPESQLTNLLRSQVRPVDISVVIGSAFVKYFNGRFFFNAEVGWWQGTFRRSRSEAGPLPAATRYWEHWSGLIETGVVCGPSKLSLLWVHYPGPDRRGTALIDRQPFAPPAYVDNGVSVYRPYSLLLAYDYGSGNGSITYSSDNGFMTDADSFGIRFDYAVAANLNTFATLFHAQRVSQGYAWGWIRPNPNALEAPEIQFSFRFLRNGDEIGFTDPGPNILERDLGYEIGLGFDWQLLEGYKLTAHFAYWQPGAWFKFACVDRSVPNWDNPSAANNFGINPDRAIDPIFGLNATLEMEF